MPLKIHGSQLLARLDAGEEAAFYDVCLFSVGTRVATKWLALILRYELISDVRDTVCECAVMCEH